MIVDFPEAKKEINKRWTQFFKELTERSAPFSHQVKAMKIWEGTRFGVLDEDGSLRVSEIKLFESNFSIPKHEIASISPTQFAQKMADAAAHMGMQMENEMFRMLEEGIKEKNNIDVADKGITPAVLLATLQKISISFKDDDRSQPNMPSLVTSEAVFKKLKEIDANETVEEKKAYQEKLEKILDKKYEEHMEDVSSRKIVD